MVVLTVRRIERDRAFEVLRRRGVTAFLRFGHARLKGRPRNLQQCSEHYDRTPWFAGR